MRTRKESAKEYYYTPLETSFRIVGAAESPTFGRCFVVIDGERERTLQAGQFEFETTVERDALWEMLKLKETKRLRNKRSKENGRARRERDRVRKQQDDYDSKMDETLEKTSRWTYKSEQPQEEIADDEPAESEAISRGDSEGHSSNDDRVEAILAMEAAAEDEEDY